MRSVSALLVAERATSYIKQLQALPPEIVVTACDQAEAAVALAPQVEVVCGWGAGQFYLAPVLEAASRLTWIQAMSAGVENLIGLPRVQSGQVLLTSARGTNASPIAEHVLAYILAFTRGLPPALRAQAEQRWERNLRRGMEIQGSTIGLLGLGAIAGEVAWRAKGLGMQVIATRRRLGPQPLPPGVDELTDLDGVLRRSDFLVVCLPLTEATRDLLDAAALARMKPGAFLVNVSRGAIIDEAALAAALSSGHLAGAGLDVFVAEPLPESSPLWSLPGVIITPHVASSSPHTMQRVMALFADNLQRYSRGEPLRNQIDPRLGY